MLEDGISGLVNVCLSNLCLDAVQALRVYGLLMKANGGNKVHEEGDWFVKAEWRN